MRQILWIILSLVMVILVAIIMLHTGDMLTQILGVAGIAVIVGVGLLLERNFFRPLCSATRLAHEFVTPHETAADTLPASDVGTLTQAVRTLGAAYQEKATLADTVLRSIITPMVIVDVHGCIEWINESMIRLTEQNGTPENFLGQPFGEFLYGERTTTASEMAMQTKEKQFVKTQIQSRKDNTKYISIAANPIFDMHGHIRGAFTTIMDFTNIKVKEDHIMAQNERIATGAQQAIQIAHSVADLAQELMVKMAQSGEQAEVQKVRATEVAVAIDEMNATIFEVARNAGSASQEAARAEDTVHTGVQAVENVIGVVEQVRKQASNLTAEMNVLGTQADGIGRIMAVINDIADQTNLLALNAAIEAARAGSAGRGFAVVADEVRKLAEKTMQATSEVGEYIRTIQNSAKSSIQATESTATIIEQAAVLSTEANTSLSSILHSVGTTNDQVRSIATATEEQSAASEEIGKATSEVSSIAQHTVEAMATIMATVEGLARMAGELDLAMETMLAEE
ncbi:MAG: PAS domain-containing protein [Desulfovibrionales bacterium]|nr:PAS domain-containing protein [Desulfovibrionales bacterium]